MSCKRYFSNLNLKILLVLEPTKTKSVCMFFYQHFTKSLWNFRKFNTNTWTLVIVISLIQVLSNWWKIEKNEKLINCTNLNLTFAYALTFPNSRFSVGMNISFVFAPHLKINLNQQEQKQIRGRMGLKANCIMLFFSTCLCDV